ncbi:MAG: TIGR04282 family arsenosugar biosynthesis glycosyltransferase [Deltaproteobacteria bacterium]|nr:TIGR04282 family arsenosugar biosynthesis glycosyltransferase [Deltaproteobacteria bacterium]
MNRLILFAKYPTPGHVKSRLAAAIGAERAAVLYKEMVETVVCRTDPATDCAGYERTLCFDPPNRAADFKRWLPQIHDQRPQGSGDLGRRMCSALQECFTDNSRLCIIGTDCVELYSSVIRQAFDQLDAHDLVIGPATDGGYYLLGMNHLIPELFEGIAWSTDLVFAQTIAAAEHLQLQVAVLQTLTDIDTIRDFEKVVAND